MDWSPGGTDRQTDRQTYRETERQRERERERQRETVMDWSRSRLAQFLSIQGCTSLAQYFFTARLHTTDQLFIVSPC